METSKLSFRSALISGGSTFVGVLLAMGITHYGYPYVGWLLGGALMGVGVMYGFVAPTRRSVLKWVYMLTAPGVIMGIVHHLIG